MLIAYVSAPVPPEPALGPAPGESLSLLHLPAYHRHPLPGRLQWSHIPMPTGRLTPPSRRARVQARILKSHKTTSAAPRSQPPSFQSHRPHRCALASRLATLPCRHLRRIHDRSWTFARLCHGHVKSIERTPSPLRATTRTTHALYHNCTKTVPLRTCSQPRLE